MLCQYWSNYVDASSILNSYVSIGRIHNYFEWSTTLTVSTSFSSKNTQMHYSITPTKILSSTPVYPISNVAIPVAISISFWTRASSSYPSKIRKRRNSSKGIILKTNCLLFLTTKSSTHLPSIISKNTLLSVWGIVLKYRYSPKPLMLINKPQPSYGRLFEVPLFRQKKFCTIFSESETSIRSRRVDWKNVDCWKYTTNTMRR